MSNQKKTGDNIGNLDSSETDFPNDVENLLDKVERLEDKLYQTEQNSKRDTKFNTFFNQGAAFEVYSKKYINNLLLLRHEKRDESIIAAYFIDIDDMKIANEKLGHLGVDNEVFPKLEEEINNTIRSFIRKDDFVLQTKAYDAFPSRYGGDEFNIFAFDMKTKDNVIKLAYDILNRFSKHDFKSLNGDKYQQGLSIGGYMEGIKYDKTDKKLNSMLNELEEKGGDPERLFRRPKDGKRKRLWNYDKRERINEIYKRVSDHLGLESRFEDVLKEANKEVYHVKNNGKNNVRIS